MCYESAASFDLHAPPAAEAQREAEGPAAGKLSAQQRQAEAEAVQGRPAGDAGGEEAGVRQGLGGPQQTSQGFASSLMRCHSMGKRIRSFVGGAFKARAGIWARICTCLARCLT